MCAAFSQLALRYEDWEFWSTIRFGSSQRKVNECLGEISLECWASAVVKIARIFSIVLSLLLIINHSLVIGGCCSRPRVYTHRPDAGAHELGVELQNVRGEQQNGPINGLDGEIENSGEYRAPLLPWWIRVQNLFNHTVDNRGGRKEVIDDALLDYQ